MIIEYSGKSLNYTDVEDLPCVSSSGVMSRNG